MRPTLSAILLLATACDRPPTGDAIAIGDSYFDWNHGADIPDVVGETLDLEVANEAIAGASLTAGEDIRDQYVADEWQFLLMNGGGNDFRDECDCTRCADNLDDMVDADGDSGALIDFVTEVGAGGVPVFYFFYPLLPPGTEFEPCIPVLLELRDRMALAAAEREDLTVIDGGEAVTPDQARMYDEDDVHPSEEGSQALGAYAAGIISETLGR